MQTLTERLAYEYLLTKGYKEQDIHINGRISPDFICSDGKRYEVKLVRGNQILFTKLQLDTLQPNDIVLVFNESGLKSEFLWKDRQKSGYRIHSFDYSGYRTVLIEKDIADALKSIRLTERESYNEILKRLIKKRQNPPKNSQNTTNA